VWEACLAVKDDHAEITPLLHDPHDLSDLTPKATQQNKKCVFLLFCFLLYVWNVVFDINQLICIHYLLGVESETLFK
jgi:hypothetical protein